MDVETEFVLPQVRLAVHGAGVAAVPTYLPRKCLQSLLWRRWPWHWAHLGRDLFIPILIFNRDSWQHCSDSGNRESWALKGHS